MVQLAKKTIHFLKLCLIWWTKILFAPNHFQVSFFKKIKANIGGGYLADQVALYHLNKENKEEYLSEFDWYRSRSINEPFNDFLNNKMICTEALKHYVLVPEVYFGKNGKHYIFYREDMKTCQDVYRFLMEQENLFMKPISAGKGNGVFLLHKKDGAVYIDQQEYQEEAFVRFLEQKENWMLTPVMHQHAYANALYNQTTNTMRVITMKNPETNQFQLFFAVQRIGTQDTIPVDNGSRGGLVSRIDLETGMLSEARSLHILDSFERHPDSGAQIKGAQIPNWPEIKQEILALANQFPFLQFIAWDVLLTEQGVCIIEANTSSGVNIIQLWGGQRKKELGDFYRYHNIIQ